MIHYLLYFSKLKLFEELYESRGRDLTRAIDSLREAVKEAGDPFEKVQSLLNRQT